MGDEKSPTEITHTYYVGQYPITNSQYSAFMEDGGYAAQRHWTQAGWVWREKENITGPRAFPGEFDLPNHPVVGVSWYEAVAFCRWLEEKLQAAGNKQQVRREGQLEASALEIDKMQVRLPTEAEWEQVARGAHGWRYPWDDEFDARVCNVVETRIGSTSAVGIFLGGASPCGALDMAGNVLEWCQSLYQPYPYRAGDGREDLEARGARVLRGGAFSDNQLSARCAFRDFSVPDVRVYFIGFRVVVSPALPS
jgi:formylglycine-generating enzyme required for sulfatase activity